MLLGTLGASLLENLLTGKRVKIKTPRHELSETLPMRANMLGPGVTRASEGAIAMSQGQRKIRAGQDF